MGQKDASEKSGENRLIKIAQMFASGFVNASPLIVDKTVKEVLKQIPEEKDEGWYKWCDKLVKDEWVDSETANMLKEVAKWPKIYKIILQVLFKAMLTITYYKQILAISTLDSQYEFMSKATPHPAPVDNLVRSMIIDPARATENRAKLKEHGFDDMQIDNIILSYYRTVDEGTIRVCYLRGVISEETMYERMRELGYTDTRTKEIVQTWELLPPPADLFTMVAHEAFEPDIYKPMGLDAEFPAEQVEWLKKQGISPAWAMKYWISHWAQPSIGQGFEMLHRRVIDYPTLDLLMRTVEIPPFWREKLTKIAYSPYTRVDVRRMHDLGILSNEQLIESYMDLGYDADKALNMANFTIKYNQSHAKELTRSAILESYRENLIERREAIKLLKAQDYSEELADYYLTLEEYTRDKEILKMQIDNLQENYLLGLTSEQTARDGLNKAGLLGAKIDALLDQWNLQKYKYQRLPTKSDCDTFLVKGIIDEPEYTELLTQHGFAWRHIRLYLEDLKGEIVTGGRLPSRTDIETWYKQDIITKEQYREEMRAIGYSERHIDWYFKKL